MKQIIKFRNIYLTHSYIWFILNLPSSKSYFQIANISGPVKAAIQKLFRIIKLSVYHRACYYEDIFFEADYFENNPMNEAVSEVFWNAMNLIIAPDHKAILWLIAKHSDVFSKNRCGLKKNDEFLFFLRDSGFVQPLHQHGKNNAMFVPPFA